MDYLLKYQCSGYHANQLPEVNIERIANGRQADHSPLIYESYYEFRVSSCPLYGRITVIHGHGDDDSTARLVIDIPATQTSSTFGVVDRMMIFPEYQSKRMHNHMHTLLSPSFFLTVTSDETLIMNGNEGIEYGTRLKD